MKLDCTYTLSFCLLAPFSPAVSPQSGRNTAGSRRQLAVLRLLKAVDKWVLGVAEAPKFLES